MLAKQTAASAEQAESTRLRLTFLTLLVVSLFVLLFARLWFLQVMAGERYAGLAEGNAVRTISIEAPRGRLLDRDGEVLVANRYAYVVGVQLSEMGQRQDEIVADLADLLGITPDELITRAEDSRVSPFRPKPVAVDVPEDLVFYIWENQSTRYPGVYAELLPRREYPHGQLAAHIVGYLGEISEEELNSERYEEYRPGDLIGWAGVERSYESALRGEEGLRRLEVNAQGDVLRQIDEVLPTPGADLELTIDLRAQKLVEKSLREGIEVARTLDDPQDRRDGHFAAPAGAAVVLEPSTGEVVAMASHPSFKPSEFVGGVSQNYYARLLKPRNDFPLINRAIQSSYPPGSVFKVVSASAALEHDYMTGNRTLPCPPSWEWNGQVYRNWASYDMGAMNMTDALVHSCDTVFYELAREMWLTEQRNGAKQEFLSDEAEQWGFGQIHGIDLPSERAGVVPGREWRRAYWEDHRDTYCAQAKSATGDYAKALFTDLCERGHVWRGGDAVNMSIGQGDVQTTPLQVANAFAAVANGGKLMRPHVARSVIERDGTRKKIKPQVIDELGVSRRTLEVIGTGLEGVAAPGGTAGTVFGDFPVPVAGKTGTAELQPKQPFAWFVGYAPADDPQYVAVAMVEEGGGGSQTAAPIVRRIMEGLLGLEKTDITPGEATD